MKHFKSLLLPAMTAAACAVISSCTQEEIVTSNPGRPIEFHLDVQSRGSDKTIANLDTIWVYADDGAETVFEATPFIKDQYGNFKSEEKIYWPDGKENINFTAFWPSPERLNTDYNKIICSTTSGYNESEHSYINLIPGAVSIKNETSTHSGDHYDLVTATTTTNRATANNGIALSFSHAFAQIEFRAKIGETAEHTVVIHSISLAQIKHFGTYSVKEKKWAVIENKVQNINSAPSNIMTVTKTPTSLTGKTGPLYIIPSKMNMATYGDGSSVSKTQNFLMVFAKIYKDGKLIIPDANWTEEERNARTSGGTKRPDVATLLNNADCAVLRIPLGDDIDIHAGNKYIFTIDFTNGVGYWPKTDPTYPDQPILPNPISMVDVTVVDWNTATDRDIMP